MGSDGWVYGCGSGGGEGRAGCEGEEEEEDVDESCSLGEKEEENGSHGFVSFPNISHGNLAGKSLGNVCGILIEEVNLKTLWS